LLYRRVGQNLYGPGRPSGLLSKIATAIKNGDYCVFSGRVDVEIFAANTVAQRAQTQVAVEVRGLGQVQV